MNTASIESVTEALQNATGKQFDISRDDFFLYVKIESKELLPVMQTMRDTLGMNYLADLMAVDLGDQFEIIYHLYAIPDNQQKIVVRTSVPRSHPELESVSSLYPTADWQEREAFDLMGINFKQHPNLIRILLPDDFKGHPLRKDFKMEG